MAHKTKGFTLIEILVALFIFAILGVLAASSLQSMIRVSNTLKATNRRVMQLTMAMTFMRRDFSQAIDRSIRTGDKSTSPAFSGSGDNVTFTRTGLLNPFNANRQSNMQRIGYVLQGDKLERLTWNGLDELEKIKPETEILLTHIQSLKFQFVTPKGEKSNNWPPPMKAATEKNNNATTTPPPLPAAVLMKMQVKGEGVLRGVFLIPARGIDATLLQQSTATSP